MLADPNCRSAKSTETDHLSVNLSQLTADFCRFFAGMSEWVVLRVAFGRSMPRHALRSVLVLLHRTVLASA